MATRTITISALFVTVAGLSLPACSGKNHARVMELESGKLRAVSAAEEEGNAIVAAIDAADAYCEERDKKAVFAEKSPEQKQGDAGEALDVLVQRIPVIGRTLASPDEEARLILEFRCK